MPKQGSVAQLRQEVVRLRAEGLSFSQIARRLAISKSYALKLTQHSRSGTSETPASTGLPVRDRKFAAGLLEGKNHSQAAVDAGVAPAAASSFAYRKVRAPQFRNAFEAMLDRKGLSEERLAETHAENLQATKVVGWKDGTPVERPDYATRQRTVMNGWEIRGRGRKPDEPPAGPAPIVLVLSFDQWLEIAALVGWPDRVVRVLEQLKAAGYQELDSLTVYGSILTQHESEPAIDIDAEG